MLENFSFLVHGKDNPCTDPVVCGKFATVSGRNVMAKQFMISLIILLAACGLSYAAEPASQQFERANKMFAASQFREALSLYQAILVSPPDCVSPSDIHARIGDSWFQLGMYENALESYRKALQGQNMAARPATQYWIGFCCFLLGRDSEAAREFLKIPELYRGAGMWVGTGYYWAGRAYERMGKRDEAAACYRKAGGNGKTVQGTYALKRAEAAKGKTGSAQTPEPK